MARGEVEGVGKDRSFRGGERQTETEGAGVACTSALSLINAVFLPFRFLARLGFGDEEL